MQHPPGQAQVRFELAQDRSFLYRGDHKNRIWLRSVRRVRQREDPGQTHLNRARDG